MYNKKSPKKTKSYARIILLSFLVIGILAAIYVYVTGEDNPQNNQVSQAPTINYGPPTEEEQEAGNQQKEVTVTQEAIPLPDTASVVIVDASQVQEEITVRAFVSNVISDGTCTITFEKDASSFSKEVSAAGDASTTLCFTLNVPRSEFSESGTWDVIVEYKNEEITGSASATIEIE